MKPLGLGPVQRGWTLIELLLALVLTSGLALVAARVIELSGRMPGATITATQAAERISPVLERMGQEADRALSWSARTYSAGPGLGQYLEWVPVQAVGRYRAEPAKTVSPPGDMLDFSNPNDDRFDVLGPLSGPVAAAELVVHNTGPDGGAVYQGANRRTIVGLRDGTMQIVPRGLWPAPSPQGQFAVVTGPVSWVCLPDPEGQGTLTRVHGYPWQASQPTAGGLRGGQTEVLLRGVAACAFTLRMGPAQQPLLTVDLELLDQGVRTRMIRAWVLGAQS